MALCRYFKDINVEHSYPMKTASVFPTEPCPFKFEGVSCMCAKDNDYLMTQEYGADWRVPKIGFKPGDVVRAMD